MTIFEALRADHDKQRTLLDLLTKTQGDSDGREDLFARTKAALEHHAAAEERCLYVPMMADDLSQEKARHSIAEHHEIDEIIETLEGTDYSSPGWLTHAKSLQHLVCHHLDEEEQEIFQVAGKVLDERQKTQLASQYHEEMKAQAQNA